MKKALVSLTIGFALIGAALVGGHSARAVSPLCRYDTGHQSTDVCRVDGGRSTARSMSPDQCTGGITKGDTKQGASPMCGGACSWEGALAPGGTINVCMGYWNNGYLWTTGCCYNGSSYTGFWYGTRDTRNTNLFGLHFSAGRPDLQQPFFLQNNSQGAVWYHVQVD